jgi:hypothetical protein
VLQAAIAGDYDRVREIAEQAKALLVAGVVPIQGAR